MKKCKETLCYYNVCRFDFGCILREDHDKMESGREASLSTEIPGYMKDRLDIKTKHHSEFSSIFEVDGNKYIVQTEDLGPKTSKIITNAFLNGAVINSLSSDYSDLPDTAARDLKVRDIMERQHATVASLLTQKRPERVKSKTVFANEIKRALTQSNYRAAFNAVSDARVLYPADPYFLSYYGLLTAAVDRRRAKEGCAICDEAIRTLRSIPSADKEFFYPILHLNLGRAYLFCNRKNAALVAFYTGLRYDPKHEELISEIRKMGVRKSPILSFLGREHPVNRTLGRIRHKIKGD